MLLFTLESLLDRVMNCLSEVAHWLMPVRDSGFHAQRGTPGDDGHHASTGAQHEEGFNPYEHPKVREARLAARSLAEQYDLAQLPGMDLGPPPERPLVCYNDL